MDGFLHGQIMHMDLCVSCARYQNPVPRMRKELHGKKDRDVQLLPAMTDEGTTKMFTLSSYIDLIDLSVYYET